MNNQRHQFPGREIALEACNSLMRMELYATETYRYVSQKLGNGAPEELSICLQSHDRRAVLLAEHITLAGGTPISARGLWEVFARIEAGDAREMSPREIYAAMEEAEDQVLSNYRAALGSVDGPGLLLIRRDLLPEQIRTHGLMSTLCLRSI